MPNPDFLLKAKEVYQNLFLELAHREESGLDRECGRKGIAKYLETNLDGFFHIVQNLWG